MKKIIISILMVLTMVLVGLTACTTTTEKGDKGDIGAGGKSAYEIWLDEGYTGTQADFLDWLKGLNGTDGKDGKDGINGKDGLNGIDGLDGIDGEDGTNGTDGNNGLNGKSAYQIFKDYNLDYLGSEEQWINDLVNDRLVKFTITFIMDETTSITKSVFYGYELTDIPEVPIKSGFISYWNITDFSSVTSDLTVNAVYRSEGLEFTLNNDNVSYSVSKGNATDTEIIIPSEYLGKPVTHIANNGFRFYSNLKNITLPNTIKNIGLNAFMGCTDLKNIVIPNSVTTIDSSVFAGSGLTSIKLPNQLTTISTGLFNSCSSLTSIIIPNSVDYVSSIAFMGCDNLTTVYYGGADIMDWFNITIENDDNNNDNLINSTLYFYSETQPFEFGSYWYYDTDGTPTIWIL